MLVALAMAPPIAAIWNGHPRPYCTSIVDAGGSLAELCHLDSLRALRLLGGPPFVRDEPGQLPINRDRLLSCHRLRKVRA